LVNLARLATIFGTCIQEAKTAMSFGSIQDSDYNIVVNLFIPIFARRLISDLPNFTVLLLHQLVFYLTGFYGPLKTILLIFTEPHKTITNLYPQISQIYLL